MSNQVPPIKTRMVRICSIITRENNRFLKKARKKEKL